MDLVLSGKLQERFREIRSRYPRPRSALIPMALYAQDELGHISDELIDYLADALELRRIQVEETLEYYTMLRREPVGKFHLQICTNVSCMLRGGKDVLAEVRDICGVAPHTATSDGLFSYEEVECIGACTGAPAIQVNYDYYESLTPLRVEKLMDDFRAGSPLPPVAFISGAKMAEDAHPAEVRVISRRFHSPESPTLKYFLAHDGYKAAHKALTKMTPENIIEEVKKSNLRGRGGAGFPAGLKWHFVPKETDKPKYIIANCDESEPGTCKDRALMELDPHQLIEGMVIAGRAVSSHQGYMYVRGEYRHVIEILEEAVREAYGGGHLGKDIYGSGFDFDLAVHTGAGAYECGEESALMESLEGKRGYPRIRPPFPAVVGLYGSPTVINNAETLSSVPAIILHGGDWYSGLGTPKNGGTRLFCLSGHVERPGLYELPMGFPLRRMIDEVAGGPLNGVPIKAVIPGGSSVPVLTADELDVAMDFDSVAKAGSLLGSGGVMVINENTCMVELAQRIMQFYAHESCGWCIPCREGTTWLRKMLDRFHGGDGREEDIDMLREIGTNMLGKTFCPLGDAAAMPIIAIVDKFRGEFEQHLELGACPYSSAPEMVG